MTETELSAIQIKILQFIQDFIQQNDFPPTIREIQSHCRFKSPRAVSFHMEKLEEMELIERSRQSRARTLRITPLGRKMTSSPVPPSPPFFPAFLAHIPLLGSIPAGYPDPISAEPPLEELETGANGFDPDRHFALEVTGDSMTNAHIVHGDIVIAERRPARSGDIVVALIDGETTLKRLVKESNRFFLQAENDQYPDLHPLGELVIQGVVVGVYRQM